jgi:hypothetical protein
MRTTLAVLLLLLTPACTLYFGGDDDDDCGGDHEDHPAPLLLNPQTLTCEDPYRGGSCGVGALDEIAYDWATCQSACAGLVEDDCLAADGCRALYRDEICPGGACTSYETCVATAPSGPVRGGACETFDAYECSRHDDCAAVRSGSTGPFARCESEPGCVLPTIPPPPPSPGLRNPESGKCESFPGGGGGGCNGADVPVPAPPDWAVCDGTCAGLDEATCKASDACRAIYANELPPNVDGIHFVYKECWPTAPSGPVRGGGCDGLDAQECSRHDDCVARHDSDWSACMDFSNCDWTVGQFMSCAAEELPPPPPPACSTLGEVACVGRSDCEPLYSGSSCTCSPAGCTCQDWTFERCQVRN